MTVRTAHVKLGNGFTKFIKQDIPEGVDGRGADRIIAHTYGVDLNDVTHGQWNFVDNTFGGGTTGLFVGMIGGGLWAGYQLTKWATPKLWKATKWTTLKAIWVLENTR